MGIQVNTPLTLENGITLNSYYMALAGEVVIHKKLPLYDEEITYTVRACFNVFTSPEMKTAITKKHIHLSLSEAPTENVYELVYTTLKEGLTDYTDCI
jgi:hypothetical protein